MPVVYIPTLGRAEMIEKVIPHWLAQDLQVRLVVERREYHTYNNLKKKHKIWGKDVYVLPLPLQGRGTGYARNYIVQHARRTNQESIIMSDDDVRPATDSDFWDLLDADHPGILGIGATRSLHDRNTGGAISANHGQILCPGGWGFTVYGLNINTALQCGNYNTNLHSFGEDQELMRQGIIRKIPWRVHCDVTFVSMNKRGDPGGFAAKYHTQEARTLAEQQCQAIIRSKWPDYVSAPGKPWRMAWQRFYDDHIPNWRNMSAIHGGSLDNM